MKSYIVDAFTTEPFKGNPAAVCFPQNVLSEEMMLKIAQEFGQSETAFVLPFTKAGTYTIRYYSPKKEIPLCGHATLAAAKLLFKDPAINEIHFITVNNIDLLITRHKEEIIMEFPVYETNPATVSSAMLQALGLKQIANTVYCAELKIILLEIVGTGLLANLQPDFNELIKTHHSIDGVLITAAAKDGEYDYHYRYFWPWAGTNEDPVTGGVQTFLAKYWGERLNKKIMKAFQSSFRTGYMHIKLLEDKVLLRSEAVIILEGNLTIS